MTVKVTHADQIESTPEMQPETVLTEMRRLSSSPADVVLKWAFLAVMILFGVFVWFAFQSNAEQPDKLYKLLEQQISQSNESLKAQEASLKVQEESLKEIQQFSIRVPIEHQTADVKLTMIGSSVDKVSSSVDKLSADNSSLREAVRANTDAIARLIGIMEKRVDSDPNSQVPPN